MVMQYIGWAWERLQSEDVVSQKAFLTESIQRIEVGGKRVSMHYTFVPPGENKAKVGFCWLPGPRLCRGNLAVNPDGRDSTIELRESHNVVAPRAPTLSGQPSG